MGLPETSRQCHGQTMPTVCFTFFPALFECGHLGPQCRSSNQVSRSTSRLRRLSIRDQVRPQDRPTKAMPPNSRGSAVQQMKHDGTLGLIAQTWQMTQQRLPTSRRHICSHPMKYKRVRSGLPSTLRLFHREELPDRGDMDVTPSVVQVQRPFRRLAFEKDKRARKQLSTAGRGPSELFRLLLWKKPLRAILVYNNDETAAAVLHNFSNSDGHFWVRRRL